MPSHKRNFPLGSCAPVCLLSSKMLRERTAESRCRVEWTVIWIYWTDYEGHWRRYGEHTLSLPNIHGLYDPMRLYIVTRRGPDSECRPLRGHLDGCRGAYWGFVLSGCSFEDLSSSPCPNRNSVHPKSIEDISLLHKWILMWSSSKWRYGSPLSNGTKIVANGSLEKQNSGYQNRHFKSWIFSNFV